MFRLGVTQACAFVSSVNMTIICQTKFPEELSVARPLPGIAPLAADAWIETDDAYAAQMARRRVLLSDQKPQVLASVEGSEAACQEVLDEALKLLTERSDYQVSGDQITCPDGVSVKLGGAPIETLGRIIQEDICILQKPEGSDEHVLTAACLCFPASWMLSEKIGRPLLAIHKPVDEYSDQTARRVQRLFDGVQVDRPLWRFNQLWYEDAELHQPRSANAQRETVEQGARNFLRMEKQSIVRMPKTKAVVFSIHTFVLHRSSVPEEVAGSIGVAE